MFPAIYCQTGSLGWGDTSSTFWSIKPENQDLLFCSSATLGFSFAVLANSKEASNRSFNFCSRSSLNIPSNYLYPTIQTGFYLCEILGVYSDVDVYEGQAESASRVAMPWK